MVQMKAYDLYVKRGCEDGLDQEDWFKAKTMVENDLNTQSTRKASSYL
jgi:hypothetical protein